MPLLLGGDEMGRTQRGNNNAYCQDNEISWFDWEADTALLEFARRLIEIRRGRSGGPVVTMPRVEALAEGLAVTLQLQGATVGDLDGARQMVEPALAAELARSHSPADVTAMECAIDDAARAADTVDQEAFGAAAAAVHETLVERAGNRTLATFSRLLHELVTHYYRNAATGADGPTMQRAVRSYRKLVTLIAAGDASGAADHWRRHMRFTIDRRDADQPLRLFDT